MKSRDRILLDSTTGPWATHAYLGEKEAAPVTDAGGGRLVVLPQGQGPPPSGPGTSYSMAGPRLRMQARLVDCPNWTT